MNRLPSRKLMAAFSLIAVTGLAVPAFGQAAAATPPKEDTQVLEKFIVTGSYLTPAANSVAIPVITVDAAALDNSGTKTDLLEALRKTVPQFQGNGNLGATNANVGEGSTRGGSQVSLRNASTLVLINGRRAAYSPADASGGREFVDLNLIPIAAIERVEILADGASAIYGTDAVSGVVNVILKTNFEGFEAGGRYGWSTNQGHTAERSAYVVGGVGDAKTHMTVSSEWVKQDPIFAYERPYSAVTFGTPTFAGSVNIGGSYYYLDPSKNAPTVTPGGLPAATLVSNGTYSGPRAQGDQFQFFNLARYVTQTTQNERKSFTLAFDHKWNDMFTVFGDAMWVQTNTYSQINGQPITSSALAAVPANPNVPGTGGTTIPAGLYGNPFNVNVTARNRLVNFPRQYLNDTTSMRGVIGIDGKLGNSWSFEAAATFNRVSQDYQNPGVISNTALENAIVTNQFNFFARQQAAGVIQSTGIVGTATGTFISTVRAVDFKIRGSAFQLPAGSVDLAVGGEQRKESLSGIADRNSQLDPVTGQLGWNGATTFYPFDANRNVGAIFGEVRIPVAKDQPGLHLLELSGAVRHEFYSDTSNPTVPKVTFRYLPINDDFALRGTYSKSFTAPKLYDLFGPVSIGFTSPFTLTRTNGVKVANLQTNSESGANSALQPSKSKNYTLGFVYSPRAVKGLAFSADYWNIDQTNLVGSIPSNTILQDVETNGANSQYANYVHFASFSGPTVTAAGQVGSAAPDNIYLVNSNINIATQKLSGFDGTARYAYKVEGVGAFNFSSNLAYYLHYTHVDIPGTPAEDTVGKSTTFNGTIPRWQAYTSVDFSRDAYHAFVGWRHLPSVTDALDNAHVGSFNTVDMSASYTFGAVNKYMAGAKLTVGVNNVFNKFGPLDPTIFTDANVDTATYGAMGRFVYVDVRYKF